LPTVNITGTIATPLTISGALRAGTLGFSGFYSVPQIGSAPLLVQFYDISNVNAVSWEWQFGDGGVSSLQNPLYKYLEPGKYEVVLTVTDSSNHVTVYDEPDFIIVDGFGIEFTNICLRYATEANEGAGWSEIGGPDWIRPINEWGTFQIVDDNDIPRCICVDLNDMNIYEFDTYDRINYTRPSPLDKNGVTNTEISWSKMTAEMILSAIYENYILKHNRSFVNIRPQYPEDRGTSGHTATGQRIDQQLSVQMFNNGEKVKPSAESDNITEDGEITFSGRDEEANRIQMLVSGTASELIVASVVNEFLGVMRAQGPNQRATTENVIQKELGTGLVVDIEGRRGVVNLVTQIPYDGGTVTKITGPDQRDNSAFTFTQNFALNNPILSADYTIIIWSMDSDANLLLGQSGFSVQGVPFQGWTMYFKYSPGAVPWTLVAGTKAIVRIYSKTISAAALALLYNDVVNFQGQMLLPGF
jgi:PKD repeat protein